MERDKEKELVRAIYIIATEVSYGMNLKLTDGELNVKEVSNLLRCIIFLCSKILEEGE